MRLERIELSYQAWKASVMAIILQPRISIVEDNMTKSNKIVEGNIYNVEDTFGADQNSSKDGLERWKLELRRQLMEYLKRSKVPNAEAVIKATIGDTLE